MHDSELLGPLNGGLLQDSRAEHDMTGHLEAFALIADASARDREWAISFWFGMGCDQILDSRVKYVAS